jgi:hypothetical protein
VIVTLVSWAALVLGLGGTWLAGRRPVGWLVGVASCLLWISYNAERTVSPWAQILSSLISATIGVRNYNIQRQRGGLDDPAQPREKPEPALSNATTSALERT